MKHTQIIMVCLVAVLVATAIFLSARHAQKSSYVRAKESLQDQIAPLRHADLPSDLIDRIRKLQPAFAEVYPLSLKEWLDGFQRDTNPEREVMTWETMAARI